MNLISELSSASGEHSVSEHQRDKCLQGGDRVRLQQEPSVRGNCYAECQVGRWEHRKFQGCLQQCQVLESTNNFTQLR